jgi:hypothetical protein
MKARVQILRKQAFQLLNLADLAQNLLNRRQVAETVWFANITIP